MTWIGCITDVGAALLAQWVNGSTLQVTQCTAGTGTVEAINLRQQTALAEQKQTGNIAAQLELEQGRRFQLEFGANNTAYTLNQIGLWGKLDEGEETLLAIFQKDDGVSIPAHTENPDFLYTFFASLAMSNEGDLSVTVDPSAYVSNATFTAYQKQAAEQFLPKSGGTMTGSITLPSANPTANFQAVHKKYVDDIAAGKADAVHTHAAGDITSGVIPIEQGGTGNANGQAASAVKLANARTVRTNLASTATASFDGSANITPGVTGTLGIGSGGTNATTAASALSNLGGLAKSGGTMTGALYAQNNTSYAIAQVRNIICSTSDLTAGTSTLANGTLYFVYE